VAQGTLRTPEEIGAMAIGGIAPGAFDKFIVEAAGLRATR
jgi:hypothetical protein